MIPRGETVASFMASLCLRAGLEANAWQWITVLDYYAAARAAWS